MTASSDFLQFANAAGANVITQSAYGSLPALGPGFSTGEAYSNQLNKVWRQSATMAALIGEYIVDMTGQSATDDGTLNTLLTNFIAGGLLQSSRNDSGVANTYAAASGAPSAVTLTDGLCVHLSNVLHTNTTASTFSLDGSSPKAILSANLSALTGGEIVATSVVQLQYVSALSSWVIMSNPGGSTISGSLGTSGYITLNNGLTIQWASVAAGSTSGTGSYPTAFSSACYGMLGTMNSSGYVSIVSTSTSAYSYDIGGASSGTFFYIAIGK